MRTAAQDFTEIIEQARCGDTMAFARIVRQYQSLVSGVLFSTTGDFHRSEDLAQETFLIAWKKLDDLRDEENIATWLCTIARNLAHRSFRKHQPTTNEIPEEKISSDLGPEAELLRREQSELVWSAIGEIPETYRETLVLYYRSGQSVAEIAEATASTEEAIRQRLVRARKSLKSKLEEMIGDILTDTAPGDVFTYGVMAAVTGAVFSTAQTAVAGTTGTIATGTTGKAIGFGSLWVMLGPLFYFVWMFAIVFVSQWTMTQNTPTLRTRRYRIHSFFLACQYFIPYVGILGAVMAGFLSLTEQAGVSLSMGPSVFLCCFLPGFGISFLFLSFYQRRVKAIVKDDLGLSEQHVESYNYEQTERRLHLSVITNVLLLETAILMALVLPLFRGTGTWWSAAITLAVGGLFGLILYAYYIFGRHFLSLIRSQVSMTEYPPLIDDPFGVALGLNHKAPASIDIDYRKEAGRLYWLGYLIWVGFGGTVVWLLSLIPWDRHPLLIGLCVAGLFTSIGVRAFLRRRAKEKKTFIFIDAVMGLSDVVWTYALLGVICGSFSFRELWRSVGAVGSENMIRMPLFLLMVISLAGSVLCMIFWFRLRFSKAEFSTTDVPCPNPTMTPLQSAIIRYRPADAESEENVSPQGISKKWIRVFIVYGMIVLLLFAAISIFRDRLIQPYDECVTSNPAFYFHAVA